MPCGHSFCRDCIEGNLHGATQQKDLSTRIDTKVFYCPLEGCKKSQCQMDEDRCMIDNKLINDLVDIIERSSNACSIHPYMENDQHCAACGVFNICAICYADNHMGHEKLEHGNNAFFNDWELHFPALIQYVKENKKPPKECIEAIDPRTRKVMFLGQWFSGVSHSWKEGKLHEFYGMRLEELTNYGYLPLNDAAASSQKRDREKIDIGAQNSSSSSENATFSTHKRKRESALIEITADAMKKIQEGANVVFHDTSRDIDKNVCSIGKVLGEISTVSGSSSQGIGHDEGNAFRRYRLARYEVNKSDGGVTHFTLPDSGDEKCVLCIEEYRIHLIGLNFEMINPENSPELKLTLTSESKDALSCFKERVWTELDENWNFVGI